MIAKCYRDKYSRERTRSSGDRVGFRRACGQGWFLWCGETLETRPEGSLSRAFWDKTIAGGGKWGQVLKVGTCVGQLRGSKASVAGAECKCHPASQLNGCSEVSIWPHSPQVEPSKDCSHTWEWEPLSISLHGSFPLCTSITLVTWFLPPPGLCSYSSLCLENLSWLFGFRFKEGHSQAPLSIMSPILFPA